MPGSRPTRLQLLEQLERLVDVAARPRTVAELSRRTGLHERTIYRVLAALPAQGFHVEIEESPRTSGRGRAVRRYTITRTTTSSPPRHFRRLLGRLRRELAELEGVLARLATRGGGPDADRARRALRAVAAAIAELERHAPGPTSPAPGTARRRTRARAG